MKNRVIFGALALLILILVTCFDSNVLNFGVAIVACIAIWEVFSATKLERKIPLIIIGFAASLMFTYGGNLTEKSVTLFLFVFLSTLIIIYIFSKFTFAEISQILFITIYISFALACVVFLRKMNPNGEYIVWFALFGAFVTDIFAMFAGNLFGKTKLLPEVSPKKTVAGAIGGWLGTSLTFVIYAIIIANITSLVVNWYSVVPLSLLCGIFSQLGDLAASRLKRECDIKDFGTLIPGHGGIMDRCDSILLVAPLVFIWVLYFPMFIV